MMGGEASRLWRLVNIRRIVVVISLLSTQQMIRLCKSSILMITTFSMIADGLSGDDSETIGNEVGDGLYDAPEDRT